MTSTAPPTLDQKALFYMLLLALQFGLQPSLTKGFIAESTSRSSVVLVQEIVKFVMASSMLVMSGSVQTALSGWSVSSWLKVALLPASLYALQNRAALEASQHLDGLTYNVMNQTKTLWAALCCYLVMGRKQSLTQVFSLILLLLSGLIMERVVSLGSILSVDLPVEVPDIGGSRWTHGVAPILLASFLSGLSGALSQNNLQAHGGRNPYLFSMELCVGTAAILCCSLLVSADGKEIIERGFWHGWTARTWIPIATNSAGGIIVGLVTKYAGVVRKGFALIFGIFLSGVLQGIVQTDGQVTSEQIVGGIMAAGSLWLHATHPHIPKHKTD